MSAAKDFEQLLESVPEDIAALAREAIKVVAAASPKARQELQVNWGGALLFKQPASGGNTVCWVSAHQKHVSIGFAEGAKLEDSYGLLLGTGKLTRHMKFSKAEQLQKPGVAKLIEQAWSRQPDPEVIEEIITRLREICLALPQTSEAVSHGHPTFWAGKKSFAMYGLHSPSVAFKADVSVHMDIEGDDRFYPAPYLGSRGWLAMKLDGETDWKLVGQMMRHSYCEVATKKLLAALQDA